MHVAAKSAVIILNPRSGTALRRARPEDVASALAASRIDNSIAIIDRHQSAAELARKAVSQGVDAVIACGGDGTVSAVASALAGSETALGVIPLGTLNHFAKDARIPLDIGSAAAVISRRKADYVDVGEVNGRIFVNNSSLGIYPNIVIERERRRRSGRNKWLAMGEATLQALRRYPFLDVRIEAQGERIAQRTPFVFVGNNEYEVKGLHIGSRRLLNAGRLYLYIANPVSRVGFVGMALAALLGVIDRTRSLQMFGVPEAWIDTQKRRLRVSVDGEVIHLHSPLRYVLRPRALKLIVP
jgi:diacylglycerol kinase family enzyme